MLTTLVNVELPLDLHSDCEMSYDESGPSSYSSSLSSDSEQFACTVETCDGQLCEGCGDLILDKTLLLVNDCCWHTECLRCNICYSQLDQEVSCFVKDDQIYCKEDYSREFGTKCSKCYRRIQSTDWVRKARDNVYHLACFACNVCKRQLSTGEEFALAGEKVLCLRHYKSLVEGNTESDPDFNIKPKAKRIRSTFTEEQLEILQANFRRESNPDGQELARIAVTTGISRRVAQVWFQNARARQKKQQNLDDSSVPKGSTGVKQWSSGYDNHLSDEYSTSD